MEAELDVAEAAGEGELLCGRDALVTDHNDTAPVERGLDLGEGSLIERRCQIEAGDLGAVTAPSDLIRIPLPGMASAPLFPLFESLADPECSAKCAAAMLPRERIIAQSGGSSALWAPLLMR